MGSGFVGPCGGIANAGAEHTVNRVNAVRTARKHAATNFRCNNLIIDLLLSKKVCARLARDKFPLPPIQYWV